MKKNLLFFLLLCIGVLTLPTPANAQNTLTVADGTTTNRYVPVYGYYADAYLRCQTIYTADALDAAAVGNSMNGGTITGLTYYLSTSASDPWIGTWEVKMMEVPASTLSTFVDMTNATTVYTGALDGTSSTLTITFTTPYTYQGGNLLIEVSQTTNDDYYDAYFYGVSATGASWQGYSYLTWSSITGSVQNFIPKTTFTYTPGGSGPMCFDPTGLTSSVTASEATISWNAPTAGDSPQGYQVCCLPSTDVFDAATATWTAATGTSHTFTGLTSGTAYTAHVRSVCGTDFYSNGNASVEFTPGIFCAYTFDLNDSYGDGWNGNEIEVSVNGNLLTTLTISSGISYTTNVTLPDGGNLELAWVEGRYSDETSFTVTDPFGAVVYSCPDGSALTDGATFYTGTVNCTPPACPKPTGVTVSNVTSDGATLTWTASGTPDSFEVEYGPEGFAPGTGAGVTVTVPATATTTTLTGVPAGIVYTVYVRAICGNDASDWTTGVPFSPGSYTMNATGWDTLRTCSVVIYDDGGATGEYSGNCNTYLVVYPDAPGRVVQLSGTVYVEGGSYDNLVIYDGVGTTDELERFDSDSPVTISTPITSTTGPLTIYFFSDGSVFKSGFELIVNCVSSTCFPPTGLHASVTTNSAIIEWDEVAENHIGYQAEWNGSILPDQMGNPDIITGTLFSFSGLTSGDSYTVRVRTVCAAGDTSAWSDVYTFQTDCPPITSLPYIEGFESAAIPTCWKAIDGDGDGNNWVIWSNDSDGAYSHSGNNNITSFSYDVYSEEGEGLTPNNWLISPSFTLPTPCNLSLVWYAQSMASNWPDPLDVLLSTTGRDTAAFTTTILSLDTVPGVYTQYTYSLANYAGQTVTFAFVHRNVEDMLGVNLDDMGVVETPEVVTSDATAIATTTATLNGFVNGNNLSAYGFEWKATADADYTVDTLSTGTQTGAIGFNLANLTPNTTYTFRTFANDENGFVFYGVEKTFTTEQLPCPAPANLEVADIYYISATLNWVSQLPVTGSYNVYLNNTLLTTTPISALTYPLTGLNPNSDYEVIVTTVCDNGEGASTTATFRTPCLAPTTVNIGEGTTSVNYIPVNNYYSYTYSQQIYTATELGGAKDINSISFQYANSLASTNKNNVDIYLGHTTKESFTSTTDYIPVADLTLVYSGNLNCTQGWNTFELTTPFPYNGTDNLVVAVDDNSGAYNDYSYNFYVHTANSNMTLHYRSDSNNPDITSDLSSYTGILTTYRNNIKFGYCDPNVTCIPPTIDSVTHITANSAMVHWTQGFQEDAWVLQYMGDTDDDWTTVTLTPNSPNPYSLSNLTTNTAYTVRMWSICGNDLSDTTQTTFTTLVSCPAPTSPVISSVTANSVSFSWTPGGNESEWEVYYSWQSTTNPGIEEGSLTYTVNEPSYSFTGLNPNTAYTILVRAVCGWNDVSDYADVQFTTPCGTETMPWSENFDNWTSKSPCWSFLSGAFSGTPTVSSSAWGLNSSYGNYITISGKALTMNVFSTNNYWAVTPPINITSNTAMLNVDVAVAAWSSATTNYDANDTLAFAITTDNGTTYTTLQVFNNTELNALGNAYTTLSVPVSGYNGQTVRFAIFAGSAATGGDNRIVIDNVSVDEAPSCPIPTGVTVSNVTATTATLTWTPGGNENAWDIYVPSSSADVPVVNSDNMHSVTATPYTVSNLPSNSICTLYVRANCGNEKSNWVSKTFTTPCGTINVPYTENFDSYSSSEYPACWRRYPTYSSSTVYPNINPNNPHSGSNSLYFYSGTASSYMAILPELSLGQDTAMSDLWVTFYYSFNPAYNSANGKMIVGVMEDPTYPEETFTPVDTVQHTAPTTWEFQKVRLTNYTGNGKYIAFKNLTTASYAGYFIDDVTVELMPSCMEPENLAITDMTNTSATLTWTPGNTETLWEVGYVQSDVEPVAMPTNWESTTTPSYTFTGLTPLTTYTAYVRSNCGNDGVSNPVSFNFTAGTYTMGTVRSLTTCQAVIYDDGGADGNYSSYRNDTLTIYPEVQGNLVQVSGSISVEGSSWDYLNIYDGTGTTDLLLHDNSNVRPHTIQTTTSTTGPLTLYFHSDSGGEYAGLELNVTCVPPCEAPLEVVGMAVSNNQSVLTFGYDPQAQGINLELQYKATDATNWSSSILVQDISYTLTGLDNNTTYDVRVRSVCGNADAPYYSEWVTGTLDVACPAPTIPDASYYDYDATTIMLSWDYTGAPTFNVMRVEGNNTTIIDMQYEDDPENYFADDLTPNTTYTFYVRSICNNGTDTSAWSNAITFTTPETCPTPTGLTASDVTVNGATLTWTATGTPDGFEVEYGPAGFVHGDGSTVTVPAVATTSMQTTPLTNLTSNTSYEVYVRAVCGNDHSDWSLVASFTTLCDAVTLPYTETFESNSSAINCWSTEGPGSWTIGTGDYTSTGSYQGTQNALITHTYTGNVTKFISPVLDGVQNGLRLDFAYLMRSWSGDLDELRIYSRSAAGGTWQLQATYTDETVTWTAESITIPGAVYQVAFEHTDNYGYGLGIDSVVFTPMSADFCYAVTNLAADSVTAHTARISWMGNANTYTILNMADGSVVTTQADTTYKFTNLTPETQYTFGVVANCTSSNSDTVTVTFTTLISCPAPTGLTAEIVETDGIMFSVNGGGNAEGYQVEYGEIGFTQGQGTIVYELADATTQTLIAIDNLNANTIYDFYVRAICGVGDTSAWSPVTTTATACGAVTLPYTETFERTSGTRDCWELVASANIGGNNGMGFFTMNGRPALRFSSYSSASDYNQYGFSPLMNVSSSATNLKVKVTYATYGSSDILNFGYVTSTDTVWDSADYTTTGSSDWQTAEFIIPATATQVAIHYFGSYSWYAWIDTVAVTELTGEYCYAVTNLAVDSVTGHTARISWVGDANSYTILDMAGGSVVTTQADTTYKFTNLASETQYTFGVVANCTSSNSDTVTVTFTTLISCPAPTGLTAEIVETDGIMFSVNGGGNAEGYQVEYGETGFAHGQGSFVYEAAAATTSQTLIVVDGLSAATTYDFYVRAICGAGDTSVWSSVTTETTACNVISTFPYTENFDAVATGTLPVCWTNTNDVGETDWEVSDNPHGSVGTHSGDNVMNFFQNSDGDQTSLQMPTFDLTSLTNPMLGFWYTNKAWAGDYDELNIYYRASSSDAWTQLASYTTNMDTWTYDSLALPNPSATYQIKFEGLSNWGHGINLDDIVVKEMPVAGCIAPTDLAVSYITANSADVSWTGNANYTYELQYRAANAGPQQVDTTFNFSQQGYSNEETLDGVTVNIDNNITFVASKNTGQNEPKYYNTGSALRIYGGNKFVVTAANGAVITGVEIQAGSGSNYHPDMNYVVDNGQSQTSTASNAHYNVNNIAAGTVTFTNPNTSGHLRMETLTIHYTLPGTEDTWTAIVPATTPTTLDNLTPETDYEVRVRTICAAGDTSDWTNAVPFTTEEFICPAPVKMSVDNITMNSADVIWSDNGTYPTELQYKLPDTPAQSVDTTITVAALAAANNLSNGDNIGSGTIDAYISYSSTQNSASNAPKYYTANEAIHFYYGSNGSGNSMTLIPSNGVVITSLELTTSSNNNTPTVNYSVDGGTPVTATRSGQVYTISNISASSSLKFQNANTSNTQLRITQLKIQYTIPGTAGSWISMANVTSPVQLTGLTPNTTYSVRLRNICAAGDTSVWESTEFTTLDCPTASSEITETACGSFDWFGNTYEESGDYTHTIPLANGCDSMVTLHLTINDPVLDTITATACNSYTWDGTTYTTSGEYVKTYTAANGCDSIVTLRLTINVPQNISTTVVACGEYTWTEGTGQTYTVSGPYYYTHTDANGCTQVDTLRLTVQPATNVSILAAQTDILLHESVTLTASGAAQYAWNTNEQTATITVSPTATGNYTYIVTGTNVLGTCPSSDTIIIHVDECMPARSTETVVACDSFTWHGTTYTQSITTPTYTIPNGAVSGCDSIITLNLTINHTVTNTITEVACDSFVWDGTKYTASGIYEKTYTAANNCDSVVTLNLTINNTVTNSVTAVACDSFVWDGTTYTASGDYVKTYTAANNCDSVVTLHLTINTPTNVAITETACGSYTWVANNNTVYTASGTYTYSHTDQNGCTQVDTLYLTINAIPTVTVNGDDAIALYESATLTASGADNYTWNTGDQTATITVTPTAIGTATYTVVGTTNNCASEPVTFNVVVGRCRPATHVETVVACDSYTWHGTTFTASTDTATYTVVDGAASGCDSIVTLHLTINNSVTNAINEVACDSYTWDGTTYTTSGNYVKTYTAANGCDSTVTLTLTINNSVTNTITEVACDSYTWNDSLYTVSGDYVQTLQTSAGCDSVVTLHLTVNNSVTSEFTENVCGSYTWNNVNYTQSGNFTQIFTAANGCDSTVTLHLTVRPIPQVYVTGNTAISRYQSTTLTAHGADNYLWNNQATTAAITVTPLASASYSVIGTTDGCSSAPVIVTVYVGDCIPAQGAETVSACESYVWHGVTYTHNTTLANAPTYTIRGGAANGCDSVVSLVLTIYTPTHTATTLTECNSYNWHGTVYTESGTYTYAHPDAHGCTQVDTLHLNIIKPQNLAYEVSSCGTYYWHNQPRRRTGTYMYTYADENGCSKTDTLYLTVYNPVHQGYTVTACDNYEWFGHSYNRTGTYIYTHSDEHGCEQVDTLHLTINHSVATEITETGCGSYTWNDSVYTQNGNYTQTFTTASGCDSVVTLHLTLYPVVTMNSITGDTLIHEYESATLVAHATGATSYEWVDASTSQVVGTTASITVSPMTTTTYSVVASNGHCASPSTSVTVRVLPCIPAQGVEDVTACGSYEWHGVTYTQSTNTPTFTINRQGMCDSVVTLNLTINNPVANELTLVACNAYTWNNVEYTESGDYTQTFTAANSCDSVVTLHLTINNAVAHEFSATGCGQYAWDNTVYNQSGDYVKTYTAANGCDSVVTLHLTIYPMPVITSVTGDTNIYEYESTTLTAQGLNVAEYTWVGQGVGQTLTVSPMQTTTYTVIGTSADQCVSTEYVVTVHVLPCIPAQGVEEVTACGSYEWHGVTYTQSTNTPTFTINRQGMCDSVVTLHLTINNPVSTEFAVVNCNAYTWNNVEYVESGDYTQTFTAANGCDSVVTLHLTINNSMATEFSDTGCGQYVWDNTVYTQSGNYVKQYTTANGCDSVVTLHLTIYPIAVIASVSGNTVIREYESTTLTANGVNVAEYTWVGQGVGQTITVSPMQTTTYTVIGTSANNCASAEYQVTVHVLPCIPVQSVENVTACGAYEWHGVTYTQSTNTPTFTYERQGMCDSVVTLHLTIYNPQNSSMNAQACDSYEWNGTTYTQSGTYTYEYQDNHGCTVVDTLRLTIMTPQHASLTASACGSYLWNGQNYTQSGTYTYSFVNQNGCTQVDTLHLTVNQPAVTEFSAVACEEYAWGNSVYNHSGDYVKHFTTVNGCDSMVTLHLTINNPVYMEFTATACGNYNWNNVFYAQSGDYTQTFTMVNGCDSVVTLHLTINNPQPRTYTAFNCGSYTWNGMTFVQSGTYTYEHPDQNGCTQVDTLHLTIGYPVATEFNATGCESYTWNNQTYHASGTYMQTLHTVDGCDSVVTLHLTIFTPDLTVVNETACDSYTWNGQTYTQSGRYTANLHNVNGCDSMVVLNLTINNSIEQDVYETACGSYAWNNVFYAQSGTYTQTFTAANGCDSVVTLHLTVNNPTHQAITVSECGVYLWNNTLYTQSGTYTFAHLDQNGCMQVDTLHLTIYNPVNEIFTVNACDSYTWFGTTYTQSGVYTHQHADAHGCTQIDTLNLTIYSTAPVTINVDACGTYIWHGMLYAQSGTYTYRYFNNAGCEQTEVLHLTVHTPQHQAVTVSECGSYLWNNTLYTQSGTYTFAHFDNNGCTQVDTLHLTIYTPQHTAVTVTECNAYTWHNTLYTQSGVYTYQHVDAHGCTQVDTLHLTILPTPAGQVFTVSECGSYTWHGTTYTQSGTYYHNFVNNSGCIGVDTLHLTIFTPQHTAVTVVECGSYIWNNTLYTQSGTYTFAHLDANGCTQVDTLHLTIGQAQDVDLTVTECGSYTWHGQTYTQSGTYTYTVQGTAGCNHTETLHLIILNPQHESFTAGDCNSYTWHGQTYTQSGTYFYSHLDANGCTQVDTLHLTIYGSQPQTFTVSECESYTWHGTTYTQSGTYTYTTYTVNGCEQIETLHLTIHNPVHQSYTAEDCEYYTWHGVTYGQSGVYTYAHVDNFGCMQVDTLHLTIHQPQHYDFHVADPGSSYTWNGVVYGQSGTYTQVFTDQFGCDSTVVLHLSLHTIGVEEYTLDNDVTVYPNPTRNRVTIGTTNLSVEKLDIYDAYGKLLATVNVNDADAEVDLSMYAAGTYFIRITTDKGVVTKRVVKQQ